MDNKVLLTEKQLNNLSTNRLNAYRKSFTKPLGHLRHQCEDICVDDPTEHQRYKRLKEHYSLIKSILSKREHIA